MYDYKEDLISIIVPVYNVSCYLDECVKSLIHQSYKTIEVILVDDGSTDNSGRICDQYEQVDKRIKVIHKPNGGLSDARNVGIETANGKYIGFVDSDDWIDYRMYETLIMNIKKYNADIVVCERIIFSNNQVHNNGVSGKISVLERDKAIDILFEDKKYKSHAWNKLYKKELFNNIKFPKDKYFEDVFIMHKIFYNATKVVFMDKGLYYYRQREDSIVHKKSMTGWMDFLEALEIRYNFCDNNYRRSLVANSIINAVVTTKECLYSLPINKTVKKNYNKKINKYFEKYCLHNKGISIKKLLKGAMYVYAPKLGYKYSTARRKDLWYIRLLKKGNKLLKSRFVKLDFCEENTIKELVNSKGKKRMLLLGSPEYNNLGDLAIAYSIKKFIMANFPNIIYIEIPEKLINLKFHEIKKNITNFDIVLLIGGGNIGDAYQDQREIRKKVISKLKNNKIIIFPQTAHYSNTNYGQEVLLSDQQLFSEHKNLFIFAREKYSYEFMVKNYKHCKVNLCPDIVMYLNANNNNRREKALVCLRSDNESVLKIEDRNQIIYELMKFCEVELWDTCLLYNVSLENRDKEVEKAIDYISKFKVMITDRLHGLIFSVITGTPCVAIGNYNYKIKGIYEWCKNFEWVVFTNDISEVNLKVIELTKKYPNGVRETFERDLFDNLLELLKSLVVS